MGTVATERWKLWAALCGGAIATAFTSESSQMDAVGPLGLAFRDWIFYGALAVAAYATCMMLISSPFNMRRRERQRRWKEGRRQAEKQAAALKLFEEVFARWPEFRGPTHTLFRAFALEQDRASGHQCDGPGWPEFVKAAAAARVAAESIWEEWRAEAIAVTTRLAGFHEPMDFVEVQAAMGRLRFFIDRDHQLMDLARDAGTGVCPPAQSLRS